MHNFLFTIFSFICGENPEHVWAPGGQWLPCCQRCTGFYIGALMAVALHFLFRPVITKRFVMIHALFLLQLGLFIFPWIPQSPVFRTSSGTLFGFGVVVFLWGAVSQKPLCEATDDQTRYWIGLVLSLVLIPVLARTDHPVSAYLLTCLIAAGGIALATLSFVNVVQLFFGQKRLSKYTINVRQVP